MIMNVQEVHNMVSVTWRVLVVSIQNTSHLAISHYMSFPHVKKIWDISINHFENNALEERASSIMCAPERQGLHFLSYISLYSYKHSKLLPNWFCASLKIWMGQPENHGVICS